MIADDTPLLVCWFPTAMPDGPAIGDPESTTWGQFCEVFWWRREGDKDGANFVPATFTLESDGRHVRRLKRNLLSRTAIALDCELSKETGELPPTLDKLEERVTNQGWAALIYTSHNHTKAAPRYRIVLPLSAPIATDIPAVEMVATALRLDGVLDHSKIGASSLFYLPSAEPDRLDDHEMRVLDGHPVNAEWLEECARAILEERKSAADLVALQAHKEAEARRNAKIASGFDPDDSLIEKLRGKFDLDAVLRSHNYAVAKAKTGVKYRHPNSQTGCYGADIKTFGGIQRLFSHNSGDPLHASNLPSWCGVTALDVFDVVAILDHGGDRKKALTELAKRFGLTKAAERKVIAKLLFSMKRQRATQKSMEIVALAEGERLGLSHSEIFGVAHWVVREAA
jgi:hypothetical protein